MKLLQFGKKLSLSLLVVTALISKCPISQASTPSTFNQIDAPISNGTEETKIETPQEIFNALMQSLEQMTEGCDEQTKIKAGVNYRICTINNEPVTASEALLEAEDGIGFWFKNNKVVAIRYFHSGETLVFDNDKLIAKFSDNQELQSDFTNDERKEAEILATNGYQTIFQVFTDESQ